MSQVDQTVETINKALKLSDLFVKFHGLSANNEPVSLKDEEDLKIILPFCFFNPSTFSAMAKSPNISFRLSYMRELFEAPYLTNIQELPDFFEGCKNPSEKIAFLYDDLSLIDKDQKPRFLNLLQYAQYISDCLPILYARFSSEFKLSTFMSVAFWIGEMAVKTLCFCFPNVICPIFMRALKRNNAESLLIYICTLSPNHRPLLHPKLDNFPMIFSLLAIKFFPAESPLIILSSISGCYPRIKTELSLIFKSISSTDSFFKLYCRCCAMLGNLDATDYEILKTCKDYKLLIATLFNIDQIDSSQNFFGDFLHTFSEDNESMTFLLELAYDHAKGKRKNIAKNIKSILGEDCDWQIKDKFYNFICTNISFKPSYCGKDAQALKLCSLYIEDEHFSTPEESKTAVSDILKTLTVFDTEVANYINSILDFFKKKKIDEYKATIDFLLKNLEEVFELQAMVTNPAPAIAVTIVLLESERYLRSINQNTILPLINELPIRFVICCAYHNDKFSSIFHYLAQLCNAYASHVFYQLPYVTLDPQYLLLKGDPQQFLRQLSTLCDNNQLNLINEEMYTDWMVHRLKSPFQYAVDTIAALGGPLYFEQPQELFAFSNSVYRLKYVLKILFVCFIDITKLYSMNGSNELLFYSALKLLEDNEVDKKIVCTFLNDLLIISPRILVYFINQGCNPSILKTLTKEVPQINFLVLSRDMPIQQIITRYMSDRRINNFLFALEFISYLVAANNQFDNFDMCRNLFCTRLLLTSLPVMINEENFERIINALLRIFHKYPGVYPEFFPLMLSMKEKVNEFTSPHLMNILDSALQDLSTFESVF